MKEKIQYGTLHGDGSVTLTRQIKQSDIGKCKFFIMGPSHYREDGTCKCNDPEHQKMMIKEWGYKKSAFK